MNEYVSIAANSSVVESVNKSVYQYGSASFNYCVDECIDKSAYKSAYEFAVSLLVLNIMTVLMSLLVNLSLSVLHLMVC